MALERAQEQHREMKQRVDTLAESWALERQRAEDALSRADEAELAHIRHVAPLMSYPHSVFHEEKAGGLFSLRPAFTGDVVDK